MLGLDKRFESLLQLILQFDIISNNFYQEFD